MNLQELMRRFENLYRERGGEISIRIGNGSDSNEIQGIQIDEETNAVILY